MRSFIGECWVFTHARQKVWCSPLTATMASLAALLVVVQGSAIAQTPPPQAVAAGFTKLLFTDNFDLRSNLSGDLSCAGTPQTATWKQGLWWEWQSSPATMPPCSQISIVYDPVFNSNVLDLEWLSSQTNASDATTITTYPLDDVSPHFAFRHGYVEVVARETPFVAGVWPEIVLWSDESTLAAALPPNYTAYLPAVEMDVLEAFGPMAIHPQGGLIGVVHEYYNPEVVGFTSLNYPSQNYPPAVNVTQPHTYGWLWTAGPQWGGGQVCQYIDNVLQGCAPTSAASEAQQMFLILGMSVGCNYNIADRSCINGLSRADLLVAGIRVFGE